MQKSTIGGILSIVAGALGLVGGLFIIFFSLFFLSLANDPNFFGDTSGDPQQFVSLFVAIYCVLGVFYIIMGALSITGGVFSIQRKHWGWALAGAIAGCLSFLPVGIASVVLIAMGRPEFNAAAPAANAQSSAP